MLSRLPIEEVNEFVIYADGTAQLLNITSPLTT